MCIIRDPTMANKQANASIFDASGDVILYLY